MAASFDAIPLIKQVLPAETPQGRQGHAHDTKHIAAYQQAATPAHARENRTTTPAVQLTLTHTAKADKDGEGNPQNDPEYHPARHSAEAPGLQAEDTGPAATVSISPAARAAILRLPPK